MLSNPVLAIRKTVGSQKQQKTPKVMHKLLRIRDEVIHHVWEGSVKVSRR